MKLQRVSLDSAFHAEDLSISTGSSAGAEDTSIRWQGQTLLEGGRVPFSRILVERPLFSWPQPWCDRVPPADREQAAEEAERLNAARSLTISALRILEDRGRVANRPSLALLAATPAIALARLGGLGFSIQPWGLGTPPEQDADRADGLALLGAERWVASGEDNQHASEGHSTIWTTAGTARLLPVLVLRDEVIVPPHHHSTSADATPPTSTSLAAEVTQALGLEFAEVTLSPDGANVVWVNSAPDLEAWDTATSGRVAAAFAAWFASSQDACTPTT